MLAKNLNNAYFRDNIENDDVKNTGFNLFLFKDTYCHTSRYTDYHGA